jgi:hypothetical protein
MRVAIPIILALLVTGCTTAQPPAVTAQSIHSPTVRAPPGWQSFCFPLHFRFAGETDTIANDREMVRAVFDMYHDIRWYHLVVAAGGLDSKPAPVGLAERRAQAVLRMLPSFGVRAERVEVEFAPRMSMFDPDGAYLTAMIPPEEVERLRVERETRGIIAC